MRVIMLLSRFGKTARALSTKTSRETLRWPTFMLSVATISLSMIVKAASVYFLYGFLSCLRSVVTSPFTLTKITFGVSSSSQSGFGAKSWKIL